MFGRDPPDPVPGRLLNELLVGLLDAEPLPEGLTPFGPGFTVPPGLLAVVGRL